MNIYDIKVTDVYGSQKSMSEYKGKSLLIVNIATKCGLTPQLDGLEELYKEYKDQNFEILGFPCNQFAEQSPEDSSEIASFCKLNHGVSFKTFAKIDVNGENASELYKFLKSQKPGKLGRDIKWNFAKFLVDKNGQVVKRFLPITKPKRIAKHIEKIL